MITPRIIPYSRHPVRRRRIIQTTFHELLNLLHSENINPWYQEENE